MVVFVRLNLKGVCLPASVGISFLCDDDWVLEPASYIFDGLKSIFSFLEGIYFVNLPHRVFMSDQVTCSSLTEVVLSNTVHLVFKYCINSRMAENSWFELEAILQLFFIYQSKILISTFKAGYSSQNRKFLRKWWWRTVPGKSEETKETVDTNLIL